MDSYGALCAARVVSFEPFAMTSFGQLGDGAQKIFKDVVALLPATSKEERARLAKMYGQQLQLALKRDIARMLLHGASLDANTSTEECPPEPNQAAPEASGPGAAEPDGSEVVRPQEADTVDEEDEEEMNEPTDGMDGVQEGPGKVAEEQQGEAASRSQWSQGPTLGHLRAVELPRQRVSQH